MCYERVFPPFLPLLSSVNLKVSSPSGVYGEPQALTPAVLESIVRRGGGWSHMGQLPAAAHL
jgi:hypothetical protein